MCQIDDTKEPETQGTECPGPAFMILYWDLLDCTDMFYTTQTSKNCINTGTS